MKIQFFGAAGEVTGSCYLVSGNGVRFLVDCGMFQGGREARQKNLRALSFGGLDLRSIDFVLLTHAHIDHSGLLPRLVLLGYRGPIYATPASIDLLQVLLLDSAHIQEKEAEWQLRHRHRQPSWRGTDGVPLYSVTQAMACLKRLKPVDYGREFFPHPEVRCRFTDAGHILGSAIIELWASGRKIVFSGDLGQPGRLVMNDPAPVHDADVLLVESTYGNRLHRSLQETEAELLTVFREVQRVKRGNVVIPAFAVGRTQELIYVLADMVRGGQLGPLRVHVDSPMARAATQITLRHEALLDAQTQSLIEWQRAHPKQLDLQFVEDFQASMALADVRDGAVIISASGMCDAGRVKYHLLNNLPRPECTVLITGFQAAGTLGRRLVDGARTVRIFGSTVPVRARILSVGGLSAHADQAALLDWLGHFRRPPGKTFVVHGEPAAAQEFASVVRDRLGWGNVEVPAYASEWGL